MRQTQAQIRSPRRATLVFTATLLPLLMLASLVGAQAPAGPAPAAQAGARLYLPLISRPGTAAPAGAPVIDSFVISSAAGPMAAEVELRWRASGATSLEIAPGVGDVRGAASASVYPVATTTYTLTARNAKGSTTATVSYAVNALPASNPLTVAARPDAGRAVGAPIGAAGGSVAATGGDGTRYTLVVPPEALLYTEVITLTPVAAIDGLPFPTTSVRAVSIAPEGLLFIEPATLTITPPAAPAAPRAVGLAFQGAGTEFHLRSLLGGSPGLAQAGGSRGISVVTARSYGAAEVSRAAKLAPLARRAPSKPGDAVEHVNATQDDDLELAPLIPPAQEYPLSVRPALTQAVSAPDTIDAAATTYIEWRRHVAAYYGSDTSAVRGEISEANLLLGEALREAGELATEGCNARRPAQGFALQRYMGYAKRFGLANTRATLEERLEKCWTFQLDFRSHITEAAADYGYDYRLAATIALSYDPAAERIVGSGPLSWVELAWSGEEGCTFSLTGQDSTLDAASGARGLSLAPVSRSSPEVNISLTYDPGTPAENVTITCPPPTPPITARTTAWHSYFSAMHAAERKGGSFIATKQTNISAGILHWDYNNTTTGPSGQTAVEDTTLTIEHTPQP